MDYPYQDDYKSDFFVAKGGQFRAVSDPLRKIIGCWMAKVGSREISSSFDIMTKAYRKDFNMSVDEMMMDKQFKRFVAVRDPLSRLVSAYMDKYSWLYPRHAKSVPMYRLRHKLDGKIRNWETYLNQTNQKPTLKLLLSSLHENKDGELDTHDIHLIPQYRLCYLNQIRYDYVMDLNMIAESFEELGKRENIAFPTNLGFQSKGLGRHRHDANHKICDHVDEWVEKKARKIYKKDYEILKAFGMTDLLFNVKKLCKTHIGGLVEG